NSPHDVRLATLAFALGTYRFGRYRKNETPAVRLVPPDGVDVADIARMAEAAALARDLINTPSNDMGPEELAQAAQALAAGGGAANVVALAQMVMDAKLKVRLRVLIPAVENAVSGNAFRPLDIFKSRKGPTVEIGNTDAEGRLVLADALALADEEKPDLLIDL